MLPKHCVLFVEGDCSRSVQSPVLLWFISRFWSKMSPFQFCKLKRFVVIWSTLCVQSNVKPSALGKLLSCSVLLKLCCCKLEMKAGFRGGLGFLCRGREREKCPTLVSPFPGRHSRGGRWQGHSSLSSWSVQRINVLLSLPDRFHHPPGHFNSFCKLEPFQQEMLGVICSRYQEPWAWYCPENWETWVQLPHLLNFHFLLFLCN